MTVTQKFDLALNIKKTYSTEKLIVTANDNVEILVTLMDGREPFELLPAYTYKLVSKPKGKNIVIRDLEVEDGKIVAPLNHSETGYQVPIECYVQVFDGDGNRVTSTKFDVVVLQDYTTGSNVSPSGNATFTVVDEQEFSRISRSLADLESSLGDTGSIGEKFSEIDDKLVNDFDKMYKLKSETGFAILDQKLENRVTEYIAKNGEYLFIDRVKTVFNQHVIEDLRIYGETFYKSTTNVYSKTWSEGCTIESLQNFSVTLKRDGTTTIRTIPFALPATLRALDRNIKDVLMGGEIYRMTGEVEVSGTTPFADSDVLTNDANRIIFRIPGADIDMVSKKFMVQGYKIRPDNASEGVGISDTYRSLVVQIPVTLISTYTGANNKEKALNYLNANKIKIVYAKETPVKEKVNVIFPVTRVNGDLSIENDATTFKPLIEAKVKATRDEIKDYLLNHKGIRFNGQLKKEGTQLVNAKGKPIQLRGIGTHHLLQYQSIHNKETIKTLKYYGVNILRLTAYTEDLNYAKTPVHYGPGTGYINSVEQVKTIMSNLINACIELDMYVIVDWHVLENFGGGKVATYQTQANDFFKYFSEKYPNVPNVIYEVLNEPFKDTSANIAQFTKAVHDIVVRSSPNAIFLVGKSLEGLPTLHTAITSLIPNPNNIFLSPHFYFTPTQASHITPNALQAEYINAGIPIFCSEFGNSEASGDGSRNDPAFLALIKKFNEENVSWCVWKLTYQDMTTAFLKNTPEAEKGFLKYGGWTIEDLSVNGKLVTNEFTKDLKL